MVKSRYDLLWAMARIPAGVSILKEIGRWTNLINSSSHMTDKRQKEIQA
jgi:hypothetical protein